MATALNLGAGGTIKVSEDEAAVLDALLSARAGGNFCKLTLLRQDNVGEIGPVPAIAAPEYLLRVNEGSGPPGAETPIHAHPGSEAFYVVAGRLGQRTPGGTNYIETGHTMNGHQPGMPMQVFNGGTTELTAIILFVVDATQPFSVPAKFE